MDCSFRVELEAFLTEFRASITVLSGTAHGMEFVVDQSRASVGRGPGVDLALDEPSLAMAHAALEFVEGGFRLRCLAEESTVLVNGQPGHTGILKGGDRFQLGEVSFGFSVEPRFRP